MIHNSKTRVIYLGREQMCFSAEAYTLLELTLDEFQLCETMGLRVTIGGVAIAFHMNQQGSNSRRKRIKFRADNYACRSCGASVKKVVIRAERGRAHLRFVCDNDFWLTVDHVTRKREGGTLKFDNLETLCFKCNQARENVDIRLRA